jgi:[acyl-carrier-protein] S-malonyltransferase
LSKTAVILPGQGAQVVGMGKDFVDSFPSARSVFDRANEVLGFDLAKLCFDGPPDRLSATDISQPAILVTSVAIWHAMKSTGLADELAPAAMAGLSLGEYTALHLAGWIEFDDALRLVYQRGQLMQAAANSSTGSMVSIMGLSQEKTDELCREAAAGEVLACSNFNCPGQIVISGAKAACDRALSLADKYGCRATPLAVAGAFHSDLMSPAEEGLAKALSEAKITRGRIQVVSNVSADYYDDPENVRTLLRRQVAKPIRWQASIERLIADGFDRFVELGPGRVLTGLMRKIDRSASAVNYSSAESLARVSA